MIFVNRKIIKVLFASISNLFMKIIIINGPNLNLLGKREPEIYGSKSFEDYFGELKVVFPDIELEYFQSNHEGFIIDKIHEVGFSYDGIVCGRFDTYFCCTCRCIG
jgi:3-dehydroquinate dehydratase